MSVYYDWQLEMWVTDEGKFLMSMTPENIEECEMEFDSEDDFWRWAK